VKFGILSQQCQVSAAIRVAGQNHLSSVTPLRNMMRDVDHYNAWQAGHG
jgi:hypothetical protein